MSAPTHPVTDSRTLDASGVVLSASGAPMVLGLRLSAQPLAWACLGFAAHIANAGRITCQAS